MKKSNKILLFIISLIGIGGAVYLFVMTILRQYYNIYMWVDFVFAAYCVFVGLFFIFVMLVSLFATGRNKFLITKTDKGEIQISQKTIETTAQNSFKDIGSIAYSSVKVKLNKNNEKTKVYAYIHTTNTTDLSNLSHEIQSKIDKALQTSLYINVKFIIVKMIVTKENHKSTSSAVSISKVS